MPLNKYDSSNIFQVPLLLPSPHLIQDSFYDSLSPFPLLPFLLFRHISIIFYIKSLI